MRQSKELQIGKAGEYLVCADAIIMGMVAYPSEQGLPYDVVIDTGKRLLRCQVKTTNGPRVIPQRNKETKAFIFNVKRHGKNAKRRYGKDEIDLFALCDLETRSVVYLQTHDLPETINIRVDALRGTYRDEKGIKDFEAVKELYEKTGNASEVARQIGINVAQVCRYLKPNHLPFVSTARYWSDFKKTKDWFYGL